MSNNLAGQIVSRETMLELECFADLVRKWTQRINLIAPSTVSDIWQRHVIDSAQLYPIAPTNYAHWVDIGSGGGFPGIVVAIIGKTAQPGAKFTLIESDQRKCTFLRTAARELGLPVTVIADRIENVPPQQADVVSARALGSLDTLFPDILRHMRTDGTAILHKGRRFAEEVAHARNSWSFDLEEYPSMTDPEARLLAIQRISRD